MSFLSSRRARGTAWGVKRPVILTSVPGKVMEHFLAESISKHMKGKKIIRRSQHGLTKGKSCLSNLIKFYNEMTSLMDERTTMDIISLDFSKASDTVLKRSL